MIIASLTSYPKRISHCDYVIANFMESQTVKPDIFYFWLSVQDFPNKEKDLPTSLLGVIKNYNIRLMWTQNNEYCCKRWNVYPMHLNDYCIFIDDDVVYSSTIIEDALNVLKKHPDSICNLWRQYTGKPIFDGVKRVDWQYLDDEKSTQHWMQGNCMIPPGIFPMEAFKPDLIALRNTFFPSCDEVWLNPIIFKHKIPISYVPTLTKFMAFKDSLAEGVHMTNELTYGRDLIQKDVNLFIELAYLNLVEDYNKVFGYKLKK